MSERFLVLDDGDGLSFFLVEYPIALLSLTRTSTLTSLERGVRRVEGLFSLKDTAFTPTNWMHFDGSFGNSTSVPSARFSTAFLAYMQPAGGSA